MRIRNASVTLQPWVVVCDHEHRSVRYGEMCMTTVGELAFLLMAR